MLQIHSIKDYAKYVPFFNQIYIINCMDGINFHTTYFLRYFQYEATPFTAWSSSARCEDDSTSLTLFVWALFDVFAAVLESFVFLVRYAERGKGFSITPNFPLRGRTARYRATDDKLCIFLLEKTVQVKKKQHSLFEICHVCGCKCQSCPPAAKEYARRTTGDNFNLQVVEKPRKCLQMKEFDSAKREEILKSLEEKKELLQTF
jgi:hypothetical protein